MYNPFNKKLTSTKKFKLKSGSIKKLNEYKISLVNDVKKLKLEKRKLTRVINQNNKNIQHYNDLSDEINSLENKKLQLEIGLSKLFKATKFTIDIKEFEKKKILLEDSIIELEKTKSNLESSLNNLREEKAILINDIDNLNSNKNNIKENSIFSIEYVDNLKDGLSFENYFATLLDKLGFYDIKITNSSGDFGIDVLAYNEDILYGFQCKLYTSTIGNKAIQEAYSGKNHYNCNIAVVVTNNYFSNQAIEQAKETKVLLWDRNTLINKLKIASNYDFTIKI